MDKKFLSTEFLVSARDSQRPKVKQELEEKLNQTIQLKPGPELANVTLTSPKTAARKGLEEPEKWSRKDQPSTQFEADLKTAIGLLNRLSIDTFPTLSKQLVSLIYNPYMMEKIIDLIYEKAVIENQFSKMYAVLCLYLSDQCPKWDDKKTQNQKIGFKRILLNKCCYVFEARDPPEFPSHIDPIEKEEALFRFKKRCIGNMIFIGALFEEGLLPEKIIYECIKSLIEKENEKGPTELEIEMLCKLISLTGPLLEKGKKVKYLNNYFLQIEQLSKKKELSLRTNFMLMDLSDLRKDKWVSRKSINLPDSLKSSKADHKKKTDNLPKNIISHSKKETNREYISKSSKKSAFHSSFSSSSPKSNNNNQNNQNNNQNNQNNNNQNNQNNNNQNNNNQNNNTKKITASEFREEVIKLVKELFTSEEIEEAALCLSELERPDLHNLAISEMLNIYNNTTKESEHCFIQQLICYCFEENICIQSQIEDGIDEILEEIDEICIDIPKSPKNLGELLAVLISKNIISISYFNKNILNLPISKYSVELLFSHCMEKFFSLQSQNTNFKNGLIAQVKLEKFVPNHSEHYQRMRDLGLK